MEGHGAPEEPAAPPEAFFVSAAEWVALFPAPPAPPDESRLEPGAPDPGAGLRAAPLTRGALFDALRDLPLAAFVARAQLLLGPIAVHQGRNLTLPALAAVSLTVPMWLFNGTGTEFGRAQLAVATFAIVSYFVWFLATSWATDLAARSLAASHRSSSQSSAGDLSATPYAGVARWRAVASSGASLLTLHRKGDPLCPCSDCVASVPDKVAAEVVAWTALGTVILFCMQITMVWTPVVTFGARTWSTAWSAVLAAGWLVCATVYNSVQHLPYVALSHPPLEIPKRLRHRAVLLALRDLVARLKFEAATVNGPSLLPSPLSSEPYVALHAALSRSWDNQIAGAFLAHGLLLAWGLWTVVLGVVFASTGACIPIWIPLYVLAVVLILLRNLLLMATLNSGVASVRALYADAAKALLELATPASRAHAGLLKAYAADDPRGRWLGFTVDYGFARTAAVSMFTIALGVWTILRGLGVAFVVESVCGGVPVA